MQVYRVSDAEAQPVRLGSTYYATLGDAHAAAKVRFPAPSARRLARVDLLDVAVDKAGVLNLLNTDGAWLPEPVRTWGLSLRGGLQELERGA